MKIRESGVLAKFSWDANMDIRQSLRIAELVRHVEEPQFRPFTLDDFELAFIAWAFACSIAAIVLVIEIKPGSTQVKKYFKESIIGSL